MVNNIKLLLKRICGIPLFILAIFSEIYNYCLMRVQIRLFYERWKVNKILSKYDKGGSASPKVLAVITHIVAVEKTKDLKLALKAADRLRKTIDGLLDSFSHCNLKIIVNTMKERHTVAYLPDYQRNLIHIKEHSDCEPMFVGFKAQDEFIQHCNDFEWFLYLEDDIILRDSFILDKLRFFKKNSPDERMLLMPNRYEMYHGVKAYIDLENPQERKYLYNRWSVLKIGDWEFTRFLNSHSGFYCVSGDQLRLWIKSGRKWYGRISYVGPRESAATGCLHECFLLYKPHMTNLYFFEVQHSEPTKSLAINLSF